MTNGIVAAWSLPLFAFGRRRGTQPCMGSRMLIVLSNSMRFCSSSKITYVPLRATARGSTEKVSYLRRNSFQQELKLLEKVHWQWPELFHELKTPHAAVELPKKTVKSRASTDCLSSTCPVPF
eukprot:GFKZ01015767.1.p1 GENE.GFKZ01015767.1~~GFKZ01015767.1.p1  ORF type:complete len:123 (+),score=3.21 GFKZ01015767.1:152-520(+)